MKITINNEEFFARVLEQLDSGHTVTIPVKGYSMLPFIRGGKDLVILEKATGEIVPDDIVLFRIGQRYILHRVLKADGDRFDIQGDGVCRGHEYPRRDQILARVTTILRGGTRPVNPYSLRQIRLVHSWQKLGMVRAYALKIYCHFPWNTGWLKENRNEN